MLGAPHPPTSSYSRLRQVEGHGTPHRCSHLSTTSRLSHKVAMFLPDLLSSRWRTSQRISSTESRIELEGHSCSPWMSTSTQIELPPTTTVRGLPPDKTILVYIYSKGALTGIEVIGDHVDILTPSCRVTVGLSDNINKGMCLPTCKP